MHIGVNTGILTWNRGTLPTYASIAKEAEELGFESLWGGHHIVFSSELERRPYPQNATGARADPWVLYAYLSALTTRLRFGTGIYQLPLVNPFITARAVATADVLSGGRMMVGMGVGWNEAEYRTVGESFITRGARADEIIEVLRRLWTTSERIEFHGRHYSFGPVEFEPKPIQNPLPLFYGGGNWPSYEPAPAALRRAANVDGFICGPDMPVERVRKVRDDIMRLREANGRLDEPYELTALRTTLSLDVIAALEEAGVHGVVFEVGTPPFDYGEDSETFSTESRKWLPPEREPLISNLRLVADRLSDHLALV